MIGLGIPPRVPLGGSLGDQFGLYGAWRRRRSVVLPIQVDLPREAEPRQRDVEHDRLVVGATFALRLPHTLRRVLLVSRRASHRPSPSLTYGPLPQALSMQGNCDELQTALRQELQIWNPGGRPGCGNVLCFA